MLTFLVEDYLLGEYEYLKSEKTIFTIIIYQRNRKKGRSGKTLQLAYNVSDGWFCGPFEIE